MGYLLSSGLSGSFFAFLICFFVRPGIPFLRPHPRYRKAGARLEIAGRVPFGGGRSEEEKTLTLDEGVVSVGEGCARGHLLKPVGDATAVKLILKAPIAVVI
jgi:hypothetical protein